MARISSSVLVLLLLLMPGADLAIAQPALRGALNMELIAWEQCVAFADGKEIPPPPQELLAAWLGIADAPPAPQSWSTGPAASELRYFRVVFKQPVAVGTLCSPAEEIGVLRADVAIPGDVTDDKQWQALPAGHVRPLTAGTKIRALRITARHNNLPWESMRKSSDFPGVWLLTDRYFNPAEFAYARWTADANNKSPALTWLAYWPTSLSIEGCLVARPGNFAASIANLPAETATHPRIAADEQWQAADVTEKRSWHSFKVLITTQALRLSIPATALDKGQMPPPVYALTRLTEDTANVTSSSNSFVPPAPVALEYDMPLDGFIAVHIEDGAGRHVRRLVAEVERSRCRVREGWDLLDDHGRMVPPGNYRFTGIARPPLKLTYEMTVYNAGNPPWMAPVPGGGWWMADHAPPTSVCAVGDTMFFGAAGAEFGAPLIATDRDGRKIWHDLHQGAQRLVSDGRFAYVVNDQEVVRIDPSAAFAKQTLHKFEYSDKLPGHAKEWIMADHSGAAVHNGVLCVSYSAPAPPWIRSTFTAAQVDVPSCQPSPLPRKVHVTDLTPEESIFSTFQATVSSTNASFGPAAQKGPLKDCLLLALKDEVPLGSVVVPSGDIEVYVLKAGAKLPAEFVRSTTPADPMAPGKDAPSALDELSDELGGRFDPKIWTTLSSHDRGTSKIKSPGQGLKTRAIVYRSPTLERLDYSLVLDRRYRNAVEDARFVALEGSASKIAAWQFERDLQRPLSYGDPAVAGYIWKDAIATRGFAMTRPTPWAGVAIDVWEGPADVPLDEAAFHRDDHWRQVYLHRQTRNDIKWSWHTQRFLHGDFGATLQTRGIRVRVIDPPQGPGQKPGPVRGGFESLLVFTPLGNDAELPIDLAQRVTVLDLPPQDATAAKVRTHLPLPHPSALAFDRDGKLYVACDEGVCRLVSLRPEDVAKRELVLTAEQAGRPRAMAFNAAGELTIIDGAQGTVRVFDLSTKKQVRQFGRTGPSLGRYDPRELTNAVALCIDAADKLWLVEQNFQPKRITRWSADGEVEKQFYGPTHYGGGGMLDPRDKSVINHLGMKFRIDYATRTWKLERRLAHYSGGDFLPDRVTYINDKRFLIGDRPVVTPFGDAGPTAVICEEVDGIAVARVATGLLGDWRELPKNTALQQRAKKIDPSKTAFVWSDLNADQSVQAEEVQFLEELDARQAPYIGDDLSLNFPHASGGTRVRVSTIRAQGNSSIPVYDSSRLQKLPELTAECLVNDRGETFVMSHKLLDNDGKRLWTYPDNYMGVQASNMVPWGFTTRPPGTVCGSLRPVGHFAIGDERLFCVSSNNGDYYTFTHDGLLVASMLGGPKGYGRRYFSMPDCIPGKTDLSDLRKTVEDFHGHVTRAEDGHVYAIAGKNHVSLLRVDGLERMQRIQGTVEVTADNLLQTQKWAARKSQIERFLDEEGPKRFVVPFAKKPIEIDGDILTDWPPSDPLTIRQTLSSTGAIAEQWRAQLTFDKNNLYIGGTAIDDSPLINSAADPHTLFQHGDALDLHLGLDSQADASRTEPAQGDVRLLMSYRQDEPIVMLYRYVNKAGGDPRKVFVSPVGETRVAAVQQLKEAKMAVVRNNRRWTIEVAIPWRALGREAPSEPVVLRGDLGALESDPQGRSTVARHYWANKRQVFMGDQPAEARILPATWGEFEFEPASELDSLLDLQPQ